jgi:hypothetical protein
MILSDLTYRSSYSGPADMQLDSDLDFARYTDCFC